VTGGDRTAREKQADLASSGGAAVLGLGLGALLTWIPASFASGLVVVGIVLHSWAMLEKRRVAEGAPIPTWSRLLFWMCWLLLAIILLWLVLQAFT
jgi:hypothetical protein